MDNNEVLRKAKQAAYTRKSRENKKRQPRITLELTGDNAKKLEIMTKLSEVKTALSSPARDVSNTDAITHLLDYYLQNRHAEPMDDTPAPASSYVQVDREDVDQEIFLTAIHSAANLANLVSDHTRTCQSASYTATEKYRRGHAAVCEFTCQSCQLKLPHWSSSPYLPTQKFLVNYRIAHGYHTSGILFNQYERFASMADIGVMSESYMKENIKPAYNNAVNDVYDDSCKDAILEEVGRAVLEEDEYHGITITTDGRHGWRKNARQSDICCLGYKSHKILTDQIVTHDDDSCSQRHEKIGTERIYDFLENHEEGPIPVAIHAHDRNLSINKFLREEKPQVINQNDTWHAAKSCERELSKITKGAMRNEGKTWHEQLADKSASIRTHIQYSIRDCQQNANTLRAKLDNITQHYSNHHDQCSAESRCRRDTNYQPSKMIIDNPKAKIALQSAIRNMVVHKHAEDFVFAKDTYYIESFNNVLNIFQDKRISFGNDEYFKRSKLAVCHWNENVDRPYTSVWVPPVALIAPNIGPRLPKQRKVLKKRTFLYCAKIWDVFMNALYQ